MELDQIKQAVRRRDVEAVVKKYADLAHITDENLLTGIIDNLTSLTPDEAIDSIISSLINQLNNGTLTEEQILSNAELILKINPEKFKSTEDLIARYRWLSSRNMVHSQMSLDENHKLVIETFDRFNELIGTDFDAFYTGGLMGYLTTGHKLERYHGDLDLFINEEQLEELRKRVAGNRDFKFVSNMDQKEPSGHEYKIIYKDTPMNIGLFLFSREKDGGVVTKQYYYPNKNPNEQMLVDEQHLSSEYVSIMFDKEIHLHNGVPYRMQSLESIWDAKINGRPKDRYDAEIIKDRVDMNIAKKYKDAKKSNYEANGNIAKGSVVERMERRLKEDREMEK